MKPKKNYRRIFITDCSFGNPDFLALYHIFSATLKPDMRLFEFKKYYCSAKLDYIDATLVLVNDLVIGFCASAFYSSVINGHKYTVGRAATGILPIYRGNTLPKWKLYKKYIRYWAFHPFRRIILSAYVANPLIYAMICKYTGIAYPRQNVITPGYIVKIKNDLLTSQNLQQKEGPEFVVEIHFCVAIGELEQQRIDQSKNLDLKYFRDINPMFRQQHGVVVIIPIHLKNILLSVYRFVYYLIILKLFIWMAACIHEILYGDNKKDMKFS